MSGKQIVKIGLDDRQRSGFKPRDQSRVAIDRAGRRSPCWRQQRPSETEMGHSHIANDRARSCALIRPSSHIRRQLAETRKQPAVSGEIGPRAIADEALEVTYSSSQVGSSCTRVTDCSGGRPLGRMRVRCVNVVGPHLHSNSTCAVPLLGQHVTGEVIAPRQQRHFKFQPRTSFRRDGRRDPAHGFRTGSPRRDWKSSPK